MTPQSIAVMSPREQALRWPSSARTAMRLGLALLLCTFGCAQMVRAEDAASSSPSDDTQCRLPRAGELTILAGDRLSLSIYERTDTDDELKALERSRPRPALRSFRLRAEVSGDFNVEEDGSINIPLLGAIPAGGHTLKELKASISKAFDENVGQAALINVAILDRQPVYVVGPVKSPGAYKFAPGMTVLQAVALAGGVEKPAPETWNVVETIREIEKNRRTQELLKTLLSRQAVLKAEQDKTAPATPQDLVSLTGEKEAQELITRASEARALWLTSVRNEQAGLDATTNRARTEIQTMQSRIEAADSLVSARATRHDLIMSLNDRGGAPPTTASQVLSDLYEAKDRELEKRAQMIELLLKIDTAANEREKLLLKVELDRQQELSALATQIAQETQTLKTSQLAMDAFTTGLDRDREPNLETATFEISRRTAAGPQAFPADRTCDLRPGDLVRMRDERPPSYSSTPSSPSR